MNYYVLQVAPREEEKMEVHINKILPPCLYGSCFHPTRLLRKKFRGKWVEVHEKLLPGYVFITSEDAEGLYLQLKKIPLVSRMLGRNPDYIVQLKKKEEIWLDKLLLQEGEENALSSKNEVGLSRIDIREGSEVRIVSGPLLDMQGMVKKINLHKMIAEVEVPFMNGSTVIHLGVELVEKTADAEF